MTRLSKSSVLYRARRILAIEKLGGRCVHCGTTDERVLEIDHVRSVAKSGGRRRHAQAVFKEILEADVPGLTYQLLCANCHKIKTLEKGEYHRAPPLSAEEARRQVGEYLQSRKDRERLRGRRCELKQYFQRKQKDT